MNCGESGSNLLTQVIKKRALALGFQAVGIAAASALQARQPELTQWISSGLAGRLQYMEAFFERQSRLQKGFPDIKSVIVVAVPYDSSPGVNPPRPPSTGRIARYAWGRDYHRAMDKRLKKLESFIRAQVPDPPPRILRSVDTSPLQERVLAELSGLGFFGKNTCLIRPNGGSFFFLGALLTNLELVPDEPIRWDCGACTLCLEACPTQALTRPYELDARRCISYLTIELKEAVDPELRPLMQDWIFGCDICQEVCPYNRKGLKTDWEEFGPESGAGDQIPLKELLECRSDEDFLKRFAGTPLMRAKRVGLVRNAAVAAGNSRDPQWIPILGETLLKDSSPLVRQHAAWALERIGTAEAMQILSNVR
ncbi:MAG: tRNA epoxyqueuosine(34) reductase QueG [Candidatus Omnitrophica bacterium]|nr:tRNA epoxyqueuosine(34) reductase QueG [Candidatus Omnitrophota bacterium]